MTKTRIVLPVAGVALIAGCLAIAQPPRENISGRAHPNLRAAQDLSRQAWERIVAAQKANEWDMEGHAQRAKNLLDQVNNELREAATQANRHR